MAAKKEESLNALIQKLQSNKSNEVSAAIKLFRTKGNKKFLSKFIEAIVSLEDPALKSEGFQVIYDIKDQEAAEIIFEAIQNPKFKKDQSLLLAALWEAGLDCKDRLEELIDIAINGDVMSTIEVLTVVDNLDCSYPLEKVEDLKLNIVEALDEESDESRQAVLTSLHSILGNLVE